MLNRYLTAAVLVSGLLGGPAARAQDQADLAFWQSVVTRNNPEEYKAYLSVFPNGKFAALARIRAQASNAVTPDPNTDPTPDSDVPHFSVVPPAGRLGQTYVVDCGTLPDGGSADVVIVVPAGSPSMDGSAPLTDRTIAFSQSTANCAYYHGKLPGFGPLPPGRWEFRWMTVLYNTHRVLEAKAKVDLVVR